MITALLLFELIAFGLTLGMIAGLIIKKEGVSVPQNLGWGAGGALAIGIMAVVLQIGHEFLFALVGTPSLLFLVNIFHQHHVVDIFGDNDRGIRIQRGPK